MVITKYREYTYNEQTIPYVRSEAFTADLDPENREEFVSFLFNHEVRSKLPYTIYSHVICEPSLTFAQRCRTASPTRSARTKEAAAKI